MALRAGLKRKGKKIHCRDDDTYSNTRFDLNLFSSHINSRVTSQMNELLCRPFTKDKIRDGLSKMGPIKALDQMNFMLCFFKKKREFVERQLDGPIYLIHLDPF